MNNLHSKPILTFSLLSFYQDIKGKSILLSRPTVYIIHTESSFYIGSTDNFSRRVKAHRHTLRIGKHHCQPLQRSYNKHTETNFKVSIICFCDSGLAAMLIEQDLLDVYYGTRGCLNASSIAIMAARCPDVVDKRNITLRSQSHRNNASHKAKEWRIRNPEIAKLNDAKSAASRRNLNWLKQNSDRVRIRNSTPEAKAIFTKRMRDFYNNGGVVNARPVVCIDFNGIETIYKSISFAAKNTGAHSNAIWRCCKGISKTAGGLRWRYANGA